MLLSVVPDLYKQAWHPFFDICSTVMSEWPHRTLPRVLWIHATTVAPKTSLLCVGSTTFLLPRLLGMLSGCKDMESHPLTSKSLIRALKKGAKVLWSATWRYWSATWRYWSLLDYSSLPAPAAGTAGCATGRRRLQGHLLAPGPTACMTRRYNGPGKGSSWLLPLEVVLGSVGDMVGKRVFSTKSVCQTSFPCDCKESFCQACGRQPWFGNKQPGTDEPISFTGSESTYFGK